MDSPTKIALIEVGSSNIRYMVANFRDDMSFSSPERRETVPHSLDPVTPTEKSIATVNEIVERFADDGAKRNCDAFLAYGTAACRTAETIHPGKLTPALRVLKPAEEAMASWVAGFMCSPAGLHGRTTCTVIDQGSGSTEIIRATWSGTDITNVAFNSTAVGRSYLTERYLANPAEHVALTKDITAKIKEELRQANVCPGGPIYLVGGVATRIGHFVAGKSGADSYEPHAVNGLRITRDKLIQFHKTLAQIYAKDPDRARRLVDPRKGQETQAQQMLGNVPFLLLLANHLDSKGQYFISGYGARHGMAFLIKKRLILTAALASSPQKRQRSVGLAG